MTNELVVQEVDFNGATLVAVKSTEDGKVYVGVNWVSEGIGLNDNQRDRQVKNIKTDVVLSRGVKNLPVKFDGQVRNAYCIELNYLPLWLAKISITPKMKQDSPDVVENLIEYQLKAKDVLAKVFIEKSAFIVPQSYKEALQQVIDKIEENETLKLENENMKPKADFHDNVTDSTGADSLTSVAKSFGIGRNKFSMFLKCAGVLFNEDGYNLPKQQLQNQGYFRVTMKHYSSGIEYGISYQTIVTGKGKTYLHKIVQRYGGSEVINGLRLKEMYDHVMKMDKTA